MSSPVHIPFKSFIQLQSSSETPLYLQVVFGFINAIQMGWIPAGTQLPGSRILSKTLGINRNTLIKALDDLTDQGFLEVIPNKGTFVLTNNKSSLTRTLLPPSQEPTQNFFTFSKSSLLSNPLDYQPARYSFNDGQPDNRLLHNPELARLYVAQLNRKSKVGLQLGQELQTHIALRKHTANYLNVTRGLRIQEEQLLLTSNPETSLYLLVKILIQPGDHILVCDPSYYRSNMTFLDRGAQLHPIPQDEQGIRADLIEQICLQKPIRILYLTSNFNYPDNTLLSATRRLELLELSQRFGFIILEDDRDYEFHYDNHPPLPIAALNSLHRVIYLGSFCKSLPAPFGYSFIAGNPAFILELEKHKQLLEPQLDVAKEQVLIYWMEQGLVHRLHKRLRKIYQHRRDVFAQQLLEQVGNHLQFEVPTHGLAFWLEWKAPLNLMKLKQQALQLGIHIPQVNLYQSQKRRATRMSFANFDEAEIQLIIPLLRQAVNLSLSI
jgi:GntR family transcriptional regulator/MocR family aminotransferase